MSKKVKNWTVDEDIEEATYQAEDDYPEDEFLDDNFIDDDIETDEGVISIDQIDESEIESLNYSADPQALYEIFHAYKTCTGYAKEKAAAQIEQQLKKLIYSIGHKYFPTYMNNPQEKEELVSSAWCGVFSVADSYDPLRAAPSTYFYRPILHEMSEYINRFLNKTSSHSMNIRKKIKLATDRLVARGNKNPSIMDIAYEAGVRPSAIRKATDISFYSQARSLDDMSVDPGEYSHTGKSAKSRDEYDDAPSLDDFCNPFAVVAQKEEGETLRRAIDSLPAHQAEILCKLFGIGCDRESYDEISKATGIQTNVIKNLRQRALCCLRMNPELRRTWQGGLAQEIKEELNFEPISFTPDQAAFTIMSVLDEMEVSDF